MVKEQTAMWLVAMADNVSETSFVLASLEHATKHLKPVTVQNFHHERDDSSKEDDLQKMTHIYNSSAVIYGTEEDFFGRQNFVTCRDSLSSMIISMYLALITHSHYYKLQGR